MTGTPHPLQGALDRATAATYTIIDLLDIARARKPTRYRLLVVGMCARSGNAKPPASTRGQAGTFGDRIPVVVLARPTLLVPVDDAIAATRVSAWRGSCRSAHLAGGRGGQCQPLALLAVR